ncbi:MAG: L-ribulose-5-phosphate 4-epimerase AraD [Bacteroidetes bacterium]|nr:L-ribulose-5-phosphate 4-epimerase AraD [Bacteroidota bacterium]
MPYEALKEAVWKANRDIVEAGLVVLTWGNASGADRRDGVFAIKPSGVSYEHMQPSDMVVLSIETGEVVEGSLRPSSDTPTHLHLYRSFEAIGGIVHTHSTNAVSWAQADSDLPCFGTTHADHFHGPVPVTRRMWEDEIRSNYEHNTGVVIVERFEELGVDALSIPAVLVAGHGPFAWGDTVESAVENAIVLEESANMAVRTLIVNRNAEPIGKALIDKHFLRKHGTDAYYGQG